MIAVDASALVAIATGEHDFERFEAALLSATDAVVGPIAVYEATLAIARKRSIEPALAEARVYRILTAFGIRGVAMGPDIAAIALEANARFGKGRHPAGLNMGDCFAYALAKAHGAALLFKGDDFVKTDIAATVESP